MRGMRKRTPVGSYLLPIDRLCDITPAGFSPPDGGALMKNMMRATLCIALLVLAALQISHAAVITNVSVPVNIPVFIPCAVGGTGEVVVFLGYLHCLVRLTISNR